MFSASISTPAAELAALEFGKIAVLARRGGRGAPLDADAVPRPAVITVMGCGSRAGVWAAACRAMPGPCCAMLCHAVSCRAAPCYPNGMHEH